jgi:hypothetical protein
MKAIGAYPEHLVSRCMMSKFVSLFLKLSRIQSEIEHEARRPLPDWMRMFRLKRLRLLVKDRLSRLVTPARAPAYAYAHANRRLRLCGRSLSAAESFEAPAQTGAFFIKKQRLAC